MIIYKRSSTTCSFWSNLLFICK